MKRLKLIAMLFIAVGVMACSNNGKRKNISTEVVTNTKSASGNQSKMRAPQIKFEKKTHDFGKIIQGEIVKHNFTFTNEGEMSLLITNVRSTCGCTVGEYPKKPIPPGGEGKIEVTFNSHRRKGMQKKSITITTNSVPNTTTLNIKANVVVPE
jgi:hypothetical protein